MALYRVLPTRCQTDGLYNLRMFVLFFLSLYVGPICVLISRKVLCCSGSDHFACFVLTVGPLSSLFAKELCVVVVLVFWRCLVRISDKVVYIQFILIFMAVTTFCTHAACVLPHRFVQIYFAPCVSIIRSRE